MESALPKTDEQRKQLGDVLVSPDGHPHVETGHRLYLETLVVACDPDRFDFHR